MSTDCRSWHSCCRERGRARRAGTIWLWQRLCKLPALDVLGNRQDVAIGVLEHATLSPFGAVQIPSLSCSKNPQRSKCTPFPSRAGTTSSMSKTCHPRMVNCTGLKSGALVIRTMIPLASSTRAKPSSLTNPRPSVPS